MRDISSAIVTGPTGAIGVALCELLAKEGIAVYAIVRPGTSRVEPLKAIAGVKIIVCDAANLRDLPKQMKDLYADAFFHLAWTSTTGAGRNDMLAQIDNIRYTMDAVHAAMTMGCAVFIGAGSQAEYGRTDRALSPDMPCFPENGYGMAKLCAGQMSRAECDVLGIDHIWPRILSVYGPHDGESAMIPRVVRKLLAGERPSLTAGEQIWDYLYATDAAEALYRLALHGKRGAVYTVGSGAARPLREYVEFLRDAIDPDLPLGFGEIPYGDKQVMHLEADIRALREDTGFSPKVDFKTGIRSTIEWMRREDG